MSKKWLIEMAKNKPTKSVIKTYDSADDMIADLGLLDNILPKAKGDNKKKPNNSTEKKRGDGK